MSTITLSNKSICVYPYMQFIKLNIVKDRQYPASLPLIEINICESTNICI